MPDRKFLARIHCMKRDKGISEERYRDILRERFGVTTSAVLSNGQALIFIRLLRDDKKDPYTPTKEEIWLMHHLWHQVNYTPNETIGLRHFLWSRFKISDERFLTKDIIYKVNEALKAMAYRRTRDTVMDPAPRHAPRRVHD